MLGLSEVLQSKSTSINVMIVTFLLVRLPLHMKMTMNCHFSHGILEITIIFMCYILSTAVQMYLDLGKRTVMSVWVLNRFSFLGQRENRRCKKKGALKELKKRPSDCGECFHCKHVFVWLFSSRILI